MMKENKYGRIVLALILVVGIFTTVAFLTKPTETVENVFTVGRIEDPEIVEPNWPEETPEVVPGQIIPKDPVLVFGEDTIDSYAYIAVRSYMVYPENDTLIEALEYHDGSEKWKPIAEVKDKESQSILYVYRYQDIVDGTVGLDYEDGKKQLEPIFGSVSLKKDLGTEQIDKIIENSEDNTQKVSVKGFMHQAENLEGMKLADIDEKVIDFFKDNANW